MVSADLIRQICRGMIEAVFRLHSKGMAHNNLGLKHFVAIYGLKIEVMPSPIQSGLYEEPPICKLPLGLFDLNYYAPEVISVYTCSRKKKYFA